MWLLWWIYEPQETLLRPTFGNFVIRVKNRGDERETNMREQLLSQHTCCMRATLDRTSWDDWAAGWSKGKSGPIWANFCLRCKISADSALLEGICALNLNDRITLLPRRRHHFSLKSIQTCSRCLFPYKGWYYTRKNFEATNRFFTPLFSFSFSACSIFLLLSFFHGSLDTNFLVFPLSSPHSQGSPAGYWGMKEIFRIISFGFLTSSRKKNQRWFLLRLDDSFCIPLSSHINKPWRMEAEASNAIIYKICAHKTFKCYFVPGRPDRATEVSAFPGSFFSRHLNTFRVND